MSTPDPVYEPRLRADPRLPAYLAAGFGGLVVAAASGQGALAALAAPFMVLAALGLAHRRPGAVRAAAVLDTDRVIEGDVVAGRLELDWDGEAVVEVTVTHLRGVSTMDPALACSLEGSGPRSLPFELRADTWGVHRPGRVWVRVRRPGGLVATEGQAAVLPTLQVLPEPLRLDRLLRPHQPRAVAGSHTSRFRGQGSEFAELRPYRPGDRLRDLSWSASARLGTPWITVRHSERTGTVLLLLDTIRGSAHEAEEPVARAARAAWAVASAHLRAQDRVGLLAVGREVRWLPPRGGRRARWSLLEELLSAGAAAADDERRMTPPPRTVIPADALVVAVTSLHAGAFTRRLLHLRRAGHAAVALVIDTADLVAERREPGHRAARRLWLAQREAERQQLELGGIHTALIGSSQGVGPAISALRRRMAATHGAVRAGARRP